jgi:hypothetical protein
MKWIIIIESVLLLLAVLIIIDRTRAFNILYQMWCGAQNELWLTSLRESGAEIIQVKDGVI